MQPDRTHTSVSVLFLPAKRLNVFPSRAPLKSFRRKKSREKSSVHYEIVCKAILRKNRAQHRNTPNQKETLVRGSMSNHEIYNHRKRNQGQEKAGCEPDPRQSQREFSGH